MGGFKQGICVWILKGWRFFEKKPSRRGFLSFFLFLFLLLLLLHTLNKSLGGEVSQVARMGQFPFVSVHLHHPLFFCLYKFNGTTIDTSLYIYYNYMFIDKYNMEVDLSSLALLRSPSLSLYMHIVGVHK